jgi:hypothetical protein
MKNQKKRSPVMTRKQPRRAHSRRTAVSARTAPNPTVCTANLIAQLAATWSATEAAFPVFPTIPPRDLAELMARTKVLRARIEQARQEATNLDAWQQEQWWDKRAREAALTRAREAVRLAVATKSAAAARLTASPGA